MRRSTAVMAVGLVLLGLCLTGCVNEQTSNGVTTFTFAGWVKTLSLLGSLGGLVGGIAIKNAVPRLGWGLLIICPLALVFMVPGLFTDFVTVDSEQFELKTGFWFAPTHHQIKFDDLAGATITSKSHYSRRGKSVSYDLHCNLRNGQQETVPIGDLMKGAIGRILDEFDARNIPWQDLSTE